MKTAKWITTKYPGVRYREHLTRKHGLVKDRYFAIRYQKDGKRSEEGLGWASEGWSAEKASWQLAELKKAKTTGVGPCTLKEKRKIQEERRTEESAAQELQAREAITYGQFFKETYTPHAAQNKKVKSCKSEEQFFRLWIGPVIGQKRLGNVSPLDLERIKKNMADAGRAPRSIHYCLATIRQVFNLAISVSVFSGDNPVSKVKKPTKDNKRVRFLSHEEANQLLEELARRSPQLHDIALISLHCGARAGEIFNLTWACMDFDHDQMLLKDTKPTKNRIAFMTAEVREMLLARSKLREGEYVFTDRSGRKIKEVSNAFNKAVDALGLNNGVLDRRHRVVFHTLRHTFASWLAESGVDLYTISKLMGHSTITMTERYSHLSPAGLRQAVNVFEKTLSAKNGKVVGIREGRD